jgi:hypothetical protein
MLQFGNELGLEIRVLESLSVASASEFGFLLQKQMIILKI